MANKHIDNLNKVFDQHPVMDSEYATPQRPGGVLRLPSHRSGFAAVEDTASEVSSNAPDSPWSPPAWRPPETSSAWYRHQPYLRDSPIARSSGRASASARDGEGSARRSASIFDDDGTVPANIPLPRGSESPLKGTSPQPEVRPGTDSRHGSPEKMGIVSAHEHQENGEAIAEKMSNYIRFSLRADVQQRTEPLEQAIRCIRNSYLHLTASKYRIMMTALSALLASILLRIVLSPPMRGPKPDIIKVAAYASNFEPILKFSESGVSQLTELQECSTAVWDLGESVRIANLTSSPIIVDELEELYQSLTGLATELTGFFATVDGDFDNIILTMDWARRELAHLEALPTSTISNAVSNIHTSLSNVGLLSATDPKDRRNVVFASIFGIPSEQRAHMTIHRTFLELLGTLESSIDSELTHAQAIFSLLAAIEKQFSTLYKTTMREIDTQVELESEVLSSLWARALGTRAGQLRKFERNQKLLKSLRSRTYANKEMLLDHEKRLRLLQQNLARVRRDLMKPLLKGDQEWTGLWTDSWQLREQVQGLESTSEYLRRVRREQKELVMEHLYGVGKRSSKLEIDGL